MGWKQDLKQCLRKRMADKRLSLEWCGDTLRIARKGEQAFALVLFPACLVLELAGLPQTHTTPSLDAILAYIQSAYDRGNRYYVQFIAVPECTMQQTYPPVGVLQGRAGCT